MKNFHGNQFAAVAADGAVDWDHPLNFKRQAWIYTPPGIASAGSRVIDLCGRRNLTHSGQTPSLPIWTPTPRSTALTYNGTDQYSESAGFAGQADNWTLSCVFTLNSTANGQVIWGHSTDNGVSGDGYAIEVEYDYLGLLFSGVNHYPFNVTPTIGLKIHLHVVRNNGATTGYVNGVDAGYAFGGPGGTGPNAPSSSAKLAAGYQSGGTGRYVNAVVENCSLAWRPWSLEEIKLDCRLYKAGYQSPDSPLRWFSTRSIFVPSGSGPITAVPDPALATATVTAPSVVLLYTASPDPALGTATVVAPTVTLTLSVPITDNASGMATAVDVATTFGALSVPVTDVAIGQGSVTAPTPTYNQTAVPDPALGTGAVVAPTPMFGTSTAVPDPALAQGSVVAPTVTFGTLSVVPDTALAQGTAVDVSLSDNIGFASGQGIATDVTVVQLYTVVPDPALGTATAIAPTTTFGPISVAVTDAIVGTGTVIAPTPTLGALTVPITDNATGTGTITAPTVVYNSDVVPGNAHGTGSAIDTTIVLGVLSVVPDASLATATVVPPTTTFGGITIPIDAVVAQGSIRNVRVDHGQGGGGTGLTLKGSS